MNTKTGSDPSMKTTTNTTLATNGRQYGKQYKLWVKPISYLESGSLVEHNKSPSPFAFKICPVEYFD